jgi:hypothetical protein
LREAVASLTLTHILGKHCNELYAIKKVAERSDALSLSKCRSNELWPLTAFLPILPEMGIPAILMLIVNS